MGAQCSPSDLALPCAFSWVSAGQTPDHALAINLLTVRTAPLLLGGRSGAAFFSSAAFRASWRS